MKKLISKRPFSNHKLLLPLLPCCKKYYWIVTLSWCKTGRSCKNLATMLEKLSQTQGSLFCAVDTSHLPPQPQYLYHGKNVKIQFMSQTKNLEQHWTPAPHGWEPHTTPGAAKIFVSGHQKYLCVPKNIQFRGRKCEVRPLCVLWWSLKSAAGWWRCVLVVEEGSMHLGPVRLGSSRARQCPACRRCLARPQGGTNHSLCTQIRLSTVKTAQSILETCQLGDK